MERPAPVRKSHTSTADLLIWPEGAPQEPLAGATPPPNRRPHQVSGPPVPHGAPRGLPASVVIVEGAVCSTCLNFFFLCSLFGAAVGGGQESGVRRAGHGGGGREPQQEVSFRAFIVRDSFGALFLLRWLMTSFSPWRLDLPRFTATTCGKIQILRFQSLICKEASRQVRWI